jgi:hypothetical protein
VQTIGYVYHCINNFDVSKLLWCALRGGWCAAVCIETMSPSSCANCLSGASVDCCDGPCELEENTAACTGETSPCPYCDYDCGGYYKIVWTGNSFHSCKEPGCPGDCQDDTTVHCYTRIRCQTNLVYRHLCIDGSCFCICCVDPWCPPGSACPQCIPNIEDSEEMPAPYNKKCGQ